jgi:serine protease
MRLYNNRYALNDSNHRFTTDQLLYQQMTSPGWIGEGAVMCVTQ